MHWFDAHLDLGYLAELGRDLHAPVEDCLGKLLPAAVTLPELREAGVKACMGTIFTEGMTQEKYRTEREPAYGYVLGDAVGAWRAGMRQLKLYQAWREAGVVELIPRRGRGGGVRGTAPLAVGILMECADPIESPEQLEEWVSGGVVAIGPAWWQQGRYAGGNGTTEGLTVIGRELVKGMEALGVTVDLSHLSDRACDEVLELTNGAVMASHSNVRSLVDPSNQRHLRDETIREIARRGGVIGLNLFSSFLAPGMSEGGRATVEDCVRHVEHICAVVGHDRAVGLGSDMDGGFAANRLPRGIDRAMNLSLLADALRRAGWGEEAVERFVWGNWAKFWSVTG